MLRSPCYVISDAHLGVATREQEQRLVSFLRWARRDAAALVVNGDLFEFWFEWKHVIPWRGVRGLAEIAAFADAQIPTLFVAGNHDCWGGEVLTRELGIDYRFGPWEGSVAGWRTRIDHGDGRREVEDRRYRALRTLVRNGAAKWLFRNFVHPDWASRLALGSSAASRTYQARDKGEGLRLVAAADLERTPDLELLIFGHSHVPTVHRTPHGIYANAGTWFGDSTYLRITEDAVTLHRWLGGDESEVVAHCTRAETANRER